MARTKRRARVRVSRRKFLRAAALGVAGAAVAGSVFGGDAARALAALAGEPQGGGKFDWEELTIREDRKSTRLNSSHANISYAVFCLKKKKHILLSNICVF